MSGLFWWKKRKQKQYAPFPCLSHIVRMSEKFLCGRCLQSLEFVNCDFAVIGGDMRQVYIARELREKGYRVCGYALCAEEDAVLSGTWKEAIGGARTVIAPIPLSADRIYLNQKGGNRPLSLDELLGCLGKGQVLFAGCVSGKFAVAAAEKGVRVIDFMEAEEIALYNTIATAEGAVAEAIAKSPRNLHGSRCLVLGYGRCGQTLAALLKGMHSHVHVCARDSVQRAQASVFTEGSFDFSELGNVLGEFDFVFNTVPALLLNGERLSRMKPSACIFDLASAPGGTDFEAAEEMGISAWMLPGLPGRYAPVSSAEEMVRFVLHSINQL